MAAAALRVGIALADIAYDDEAEAFAIFQAVFAPLDIDVIDTGERTIFQSAESPLRFVIEILRNPEVHIVGGMFAKSILQPLINRITSVGKNGLSALWQGLQRQFEGRKIQVEILVPIEGGQLYYALPGPEAADRAIAAIPSDLAVSDPAYPDRFWEGDKWISPGEEMALRRKLP